MKKVYYTNLCTPAKFYLIISLIAVVFYVNDLYNKRNKLKSIDLITNILMIILWTYVLNWICGKKYGESIAWLLIFLPLIMMILLVILFIIFINKTEINKDELDELLEKDCDKCKI